MPVGPGQPVWAPPGGPGRTLLENGPSAGDSSHIIPVKSLKDLPGAVRPSGAPLGRGVFLTKARGPNGCRLSSQNSVSASELHLEPRVVTHQRCRGGSLGAGGGGPARWV